MLLKWPPRSPDLTPSDFCLWGYVKGLVYVPLLPTNVVELKQKIYSALETVTENVLQRVWDKLDYRIWRFAVLQEEHTLKICEFLKLNKQVCRTADNA